MKKFGLMVWLEAIGLAALMMVSSVRATSFDLVPLGIEDMARYGATHVLDVSYKDWVGYTTSTNTTAVNTNAIPAGSMVQFVLMKLDGAWDCETYTDSLLIYSGWAADTDVFLESTEIAADGTEIWSKATPFNFQTGLDNFGGSTNYVTNITTRKYGWTYCTTATNLLTTFKQNSHGSCISSNIAGRVRLFWKIYTH
jgi:hypothetical protein